MQTSYKQYVNKTTTNNVFSTERQHKTDIRPKNIQHTTNKYFICNSTDTTTKIPIHTNNRKLRTMINAIWKCKRWDKKKNDTNDLVIFCKLKIQTSYQPNENNDKQTLFNRDTTQIKHTEIWQATNNKHILYMWSHTKEIRPKILSIKNYRQVVVQVGTSNNITKRSMTRTTWLLLAIWTYKHHIKKGKQRQIDVSKRSTTQGRKYGTRTNNKQQTNS